VQAEAEALTTARRAARPGADLGAVVGAQAQHAAALGVQEQHAADLTTAHADLARVESFMSREQRAAQAAADLALAGRQVAQVDAARAAWWDATRRVRDAEAAHAATVARLAGAVSRGEVARADVPSLPPYTEPLLSVINSAEYQGLTPAPVDPEALE